MSNPDVSAVTGAFSYTGKYITRRLLSSGHRAINLTNHPNNPNPFGSQVGIAPLDFTRPDKLTENLKGVSVLFNTYWIRFPYRQNNYDRAVDNTKILIQSARSAGVRRIVHISVTSASETSPFPYFRGKWLVERAIINSGLSYTIIRPALIFGPEDILINNIGWLLRHFPFFAIPGDGNCRVQPVFVEDVAEICVMEARKEDHVIIDAIGPVAYTFNELVKLIKESINSQSKIIHTNPSLALLFSKIVGWLVHDIVLTRDEVDGLLANTLSSSQSPLGRARLSEWLGQNADTIGVKYTSELKRHYR